jgi:hypothetical protein
MRADKQLLSLMSALSPCMSAEKIGDNGHGDRWHEKWDEVTSTLFFRVASCGLRVAGLYKL